MKQVKVIANRRSSGFEGEGKFAIAEQGTTDYKATKFAVLTDVVVQRADRFEKEYGCSVMIGATHQEEAQQETFERPQFSGFLKFSDMDGGFCDYETNQLVKRATMVVLDQSQPDGQQIGYVL